MICTFSRQEMIIGKRLSTLKHKARKDADEHLAVHVGQQIEEIRANVEIRNAHTEQGLPKEFHKELKTFEQ
jgi:hypothetical protein